MPGTILFGKLSSTIAGGAATAGVGVRLGSSEDVDGALFLLAGSAFAPRAGSFLFLSIIVACCLAARKVVVARRVAVRQLEM